LRPPLAERGNPIKIGDLVRWNASPKISNTGIVIEVGNSWGSPAVRIVWQNPDLDPADRFYKIDVRFLEVISENR